MCKNIGQAVNIKDVKCQRLRRAGAQYYGLTSLAISRVGSNATQRNRGIYRERMSSVSHNASQKQSIYSGSSNQLDRVVGKNCYAAVWRCNNTLSISTTVPMVLLDTATDAIGHVQLLRPEILLRFERQNF